MPDGNTKLNLTLAPLWYTKSGNGNLTCSLKNEKTLREIADAVAQLEVGGRLLLKFLPEERRKIENSPHAYLEYISADKVAEFQSGSYSKSSKTEEEVI